jgi:hypothetical protein
MNARFVAFLVEDILERTLVGPTIVMHMANGRANAFI